MGASPSSPLVFVCNVSKEMEVGKSITVTARVSPNAARFSVDLKCANGDIALHFNPRFDEELPVVVCNTCTNNVWGTEERTLQMPFRKGEYFEMTIAVKDSYYEVSVNGEYFLRYPHRLPFHTVTELEYKGDIKFEEKSHPSTEDPPPAPYRPPVQVVIPYRQEVFIPESDTPDEPKRFVHTDQDVPVADSEPAGCCYCRIFFRSLRLKWIKLKVNGDVAIHVNKAV